MRRRGQKREVVFDPEARKAHLRGFSERKRQRRAYGLAMQKVKDRKAKIEERAQMKKEDLERVEQAEQQKEQLLAESMEVNKNIRLEESEDESDGENDAKPLETSKQNSKESLSSRIDDNLLQTKTYDDKEAKDHWGGRVTVTTSEFNMGHFDSSDDEDVDLYTAAASRSIDVHQKEAGKVKKYLAQLKGNMPSKKNKDAGYAKRKGRNGAAEMKGIGGAGNLKIAQRVLTTAKSKQNVGTVKRKGGKKKSR